MTLQNSAVSSEWIAAASPGLSRPPLLSDWFRSRHPPPPSLAAVCFGSRSPAVLTLQMTAVKGGRTLLVSVRSLEEDRVLQCAPV